MWIVGADIDQFILFEIIALAHGNTIYILDLVTSDGGLGENIPRELFNLLKVRILNVNSAPFCKVFPYIKNFKKLCTIYCSKFSQFEFNILLSHFPNLYSPGHYRIG